MSTTKRNGDDGLARLNESKMRIENVLGRTSFDARLKPSDDVFKSEIDRMAEEARRRQYDRPVDLAVALVDAPIGLESMTAPAESPTQQLMREAIQLIQEERFEDALGKLMELLGQAPGHHEATYYTAYCHMMLEHDEDALRALLPLRGIPLDNRLSIRVQTLKDGIRARMLLPMLLEAMLLMGANQHEELIGRLTRVLTLDPECGLYYYLLGGTYLHTAKLGKAQESVEQGLQACDAGARSMLEGLLKQISSHRCAQEMGPARRLFKEGKYREARKALHMLNSAYRTLPLYLTFDGYLGRLEGGGLLGLLQGSRSVSEVTPPGAFKEVDALYFFLVGDEIREAKRLLPDGELSKAEGILHKALTSCPRFPFANYLYAGCLYRGMGEQMNDNNPPDIEVVAATLERAKSHAGMAQVDPEIIEDVRELGADIQKALDLVQRFRAEVMARKEEARPVNALIDEFHAIIESAQGGVGSPQQLKNLLARMRTLKGKIPGIQQKVRSPEGREAIKQLTEAVNRNLEQLDGVTTESQLVGKNVSKFNSKMESLKRAPISSYDQLSSARSFFKNLLLEVQADAKKCRSADAKEVLSKLQEAITNVLSQLPK